ncbi:MAG: glycosyltransferase [Desulfamplus sp.]|nr:glycosyltransferase [Desulfamplus sp.]
MINRDTELRFWQLGAVLLLLLYLTASSAFLAIEHQIIMGAAILCAAFVADFFGSPYFPSPSVEQRGQFLRILIMVLCGFLTLRYWFFRTTVTITFDSLTEFSFSMLLYLAETYGILIFFLGMFVNASPIQRQTPRMQYHEDELPEVDVYIPTYNESEDVVRITALAATSMFYPQEKLNIYILDDGGTVNKLSDPDPGKALGARQRAQRLKEIARELSIIYATRDENIHAKAGNLNESLMSCECRLDEDAFDKMSCINQGIHQGCGQLIVILDCDHVPARDFLKKTVGFFLEDPRLFLLQTPHFFINPDPIEKNLETFRKGPSENEMFYAAIHPGLDFWNASFFCGSAAIMRRNFLLEVGGIAGETITEDAETALGLHAKGYNSAYFFKPLIIGLTPETFDDFIVQRSRWAQGMIQIFILKNPLFQKGLTIFQKMCYINASFFWFFGFARVIFFLSPLILLFFGLKIYNASIAQVIAYALPHLAGAYLLSNYLFGRYRYPFFSELYESVISFYLLPAIISAIRKPRSPVFKVTPKAVSLKKDFLSHLAMPFYIMFFLSIAGYAAGLYQWVNTPGPKDSIVISLLWNTFNLVIVLSCLGVVWEKRQMRKQHRYPAEEDVILQTDRGETRIPAKTFDLSISGAGLAVELDAAAVHAKAREKNREGPLDGDGNIGRSPDDVDGNREGNPLDGDGNSKGSTAYGDAAIRDFTREDVILHARDSYGNLYELPIKVVHQRRRGSQIILGTLFKDDSGENLRNIVNFVYGDSSRWQFFSEKPSASTIGYLRGFYRLIKIGVSGTVTNFKGLCSMAIGSLPSVKERPLPEASEATLQKEK